MLRKALTLGMVFILALSLLVVSMITCFTYDAEADDQVLCEKDGCVHIFLDPGPAGWDCVPHGHFHTG